MNKNILKLITLLLSTTLVVSCKTPTRSSSSENNHYGDISNSGVTSSDIPSTSSIDDEEQGELDAIIADFTSDLDVIVPSVDEYNLYYEVFFYYGYQQYVISAAITDNSNIESSYLAKFTNSATLVSLNDDSSYKVEDYGYMFGDDANNPNLTITFYTEEGVFYLTITRSDGLYGTLDVSDIDTNWYVDYVNFYNYIVDEEFPGTDISVSLETETVVPSLQAEYYPYLFAPQYLSEDSNEFILTYSVIFKGDQVKNYANTLKNAGFEVNIIETVEQDIDWDTFEVVDITYYTATAYDTNHTLYVVIATDELGNTNAVFYQFNEVMSDTLTTNTDWTDKEKELMRTTLGESLPFLQFGNGYQLYDDSDEEWTLLVLEDSYYQDLCDDYIALLLADGYKEDSVTYSSTFYYKDNGFAYIEVFPDYTSGHYFEIYYEPSKLPAVESISFKEAVVQICAGGTYQLEPIFEPAGSKSPITYQSIAYDIATIDENNVVHIDENAQVGEYAQFWAITANGKIGSIEFRIVENSVTGIKFTQENYNVVPGGAKIQPVWTTLPIGSNFLGSVDYRISAGAADGVYYENGYLWATSEATIGSTYTIYVRLNDEFEASATVTVVDPTVTHTLNQEFFGLTNGKTEYATHTKTTEDGATYEAQCASQTGIQIRSKNSNSGIIGHFEGRSCKSITFTFASTSNQQRTVNIYGSNDAFSIEDMYSMTPVGSITFSGSAPYTFTYDFTDSYSYIGFRSNNGACYLDSIVIIWE